MILTFTARADKKQNGDEGTKEVSVVFAHQFKGKENDNDFSPIIITGGVADLSESFESTIADIARDQKRLAELKTTSTGRVDQKKKQLSDAIQKHTKAADKSDPKKEGEQKEERKTEAKEEKPKPYMTDLFSMSPARPATSETATAASASESEPLGRKRQRRWTMGETRLEVKPLLRVFRYGALELEDPDPKSTAEEVKDFWGDVYPELTQAVIEGPEVQGRPGRIHVQTGRRDKRQHERCEGQRKQRQRDNRYAANNGRPCARRSHRGPRRRPGPSAVARAGAGMKSPALKVTPALLSVPEILEQLGYFSSTLIPSMVRFCESLTGKAVDISSIPERVLSERSWGDR